MSIPGYLTIQQAAARLGVDVSQVRRYCLGQSQVKLHAEKAGNRWMIPEEEIEKFTRPEVGNPNLKKS